jgi:hypothetical protein
LDVSGAIKVKEEASKWLRWSLIALRKYFFILNLSWLALVTWYDLKIEFFSTGFLVSTGENKSFGYVFLSC